MSFKSKFSHVLRGALISSAALMLSACGGDTPVAAFTMQLLHVSDADGSDSTTLNSDKTRQA